MSEAESSGRSVDVRGRRARQEAIRVTPIGGGIYEVSTPSGHEYTVDLEDGRCTCPDHRFRDVRCKHLRRVAIEVTAGRTPAPGQREAACADCGRQFFAPESSPDPVYCGRCVLQTGETVVDRETGSLLVVAESTDDRANEVRIPERDWSVADHFSNQSYDPQDVVVDALYPLRRGVSPDGIAPQDLKRYSFPRGRLRRAGQ